MIIWKQKAPANVVALSIIASATSLDVLQTVVVPLLVELNALPPYEGKHIAYIAKTFRKS